jgi:TATA-binding protein-associated factor
MHTDRLSTSSLADSDDDVRSVSATCLLPILPLLAESLGTDDLAGLLDTLWNCFSVDGDDLGSSTSAVMDLLCESARCCALQGRPRD